jgi:TonB family protein
VASQITSGVVYRFLHRPVSAPRVRLFVEAALRRHEVENVERTLEQVTPDFSKMEAPKSEPFERRSGKPLFMAFGGLALAAITVGAWYLFSGGRAPEGAVPTAQVVSQDAAMPAEPAAAEDTQPAPVDSVPQAGEPMTNAAAAGEAAPVAAAATAPEPEPAPSESVADTLRAAGSVSNTPESIPATAPPAPAAADTQAPVARTEELPVETAPPPPAPMTFEQRLQDQLVKAESALQRGELYTPSGRSAVDLFRGALELDPANTLAKAGLVRVADRLLTEAERALTAGKPDEARRMVNVAESLTPATARAAFLMMQIEMERERVALTAKRDADAQNRAERGATYLRLANARLQDGRLIDPPQDNARFYLEAARQTVPDDPQVAELSRDLQKELLARAGAAASAGNAAETERLLANADSAGAPRQELTSIRRMLQEELITGRNARMTALTQSFNASLSGGRLLKPDDGSARHYYFELVKTDAANPAVPGARQSLGKAYLVELRRTLSQGDLPGADAWLNEALAISYSGADLNTARSEIENARAIAAERTRVVGANTIPRVHYEAPVIPNSLRSRTLNGWVELEFTVFTDGRTGDIVVTNSSPRKTFDSAATNAVAKWRYKPVIGREGKPINQRAAVRIRFAEE